MLEGYGLSETASTASFNRPEDRRPLSVGKPIWGVQMRIDDEQDKPLPSGQDNVGEILIRGHNVMKGYLGQAGGDRGGAQQRLVAHRRPGLRR